MSTIEERRQIATAGVQDAPADAVAARVFLQPIAAPSVLGLFGFGVATFMVAANVAGWYDDASFGYWFFALAIVTGSGALAALAENLGVFATLATLAVGSGVLAGALIYGSEGWATVA